MVLHVCFEPWHNSKAPAKWFQHFNAAYRNSVGRHMLLAFGHPVTTSCDMLGGVCSSLKVWTWCSLQCCDHLTGTLPAIAKQQSEMSTFHETTWAIPANFEFLNFWIERCHITFSSARFYTARPTEQLRTVATIECKLSIFLQGVVLGATVVSYSTEFICDRRPAYCYDQHCRIHRELW